MKTFIQALIFGTLTFLAPIQGLVIIAMLFVGMDTIIGIYASMKCGYKFRSSRLFNLAVKTFFYTGSILLAFLIDTFVFGGTAMGVKLLSAKICTIIWCYIESKSMDEKSQMIGNRPIWVIIKEGIKRAKSVKDDIKNIIS
jgi:hypothetical protein